MPPKNPRPTTPTQPEQAVVSAVVTDDDDDEDLRLSDRDIAEIARRIKPGQLEQLAVHVRGADVAKHMADLGVIPGTHLIPLTNVRASRKDGKGGLIKSRLLMGEPVRRDELDPDELADMTTAKVRPGHGADPCVLLAEPSSPAAMAVLQATH